MKRFILAALTLALCLGFAAQASAKSDLVIAIDAPPRTMNPHGSDADSNLGIVANIFDGLLQRPGTDGHLKPALATKFERINALTWKFYLRKGVTFHNGNAFNAQDVKFTFERMGDPNYSEFVNTAKSIAEVEIVDDYTVIFKTVKPIPWFAENMHQIFIVDKESSEGRDPGEYGTRPIGTGAYKLVEWVKGSYLRLEANNDYWGGAPTFQKVEMRPITESATRFAAIMSKQADIVRGVPVEMIDRIKKLPTVDIVSRPARRSIFLAVSNQVEPLKDIRVRKAIAHAINEQEIIEKIMRGQATPAAQIPDVPTIGYNAGLKRLAYNPEKSKALLKEAGYENGFELTLAGPNDRYVQDEKICEAIVKYLAKVGIKAKLDVKPKSIFFDEVYNGKHPFYLIGWFDGSFDFGRSAEKLLHTHDAVKGYGGWNGARSSYPEIDAKLEASASILDRTERDKALQEINAAAINNLAWIPLHYQQDVYTVAKGKGIKFQPRPDRWILVKEITK